MKYLLSLLLWVAVVGLVGTLASPTSGAAEPTVIVPPTRGPLPYPIFSTATPLATPTLKPPPYPMPYVTPVTLDATADLLLSVDGPALVHRGGVVQVRYTVVNLGPSPVRGATLIIALPPSYYLDHVQTWMGWTCSVHNYAASTLTRPVTILCQRDNWLLAKVIEDVRLDLTLTTSALDRKFLGIQAALLSTGIDLTPNWVEYAPGID